MIYLYVKQHTVTGLKYFGKTVRADPFRYRGSGTYWRNHCNKHGWNISTVEIYGFDDQQLCTEFAIRFSRDNSIVDSPDWANQIIEDGICGFGKGHTLGECHGGSVWITDGRENKRIRATDNIPTGYCRGMTTVVHPSNPEHQRRACAAAQLVNLGRKGISRPGLSNTNADHNTYTFVNGDVIFVGTRQQMVAKHPVTTNGLTNIVTGRRKSHRGWTVNAPSTAIH